MAPARGEHEPNVNNSVSIAIRAMSASCANRTIAPDLHVVKRSRAPRGLPFSLVNHILLARENGQPVFAEEVQGHSAVVGQYAIGVVALSLLHAQIEDGLRRGRGVPACIFRAENHYL